MIDFPSDSTAVRNAACQRSSLSFEPAFGPSVGKRCRRIHAGRVCRRCPLEPCTCTPVPKNVNRHVKHEPIKARVYPCRPKDDLIRLNQVQRSEALGGMFLTDAFRTFCTPSRHMRPKK